MEREPPAPRRGTRDNPANRFERLEVVFEEGEGPREETQFLVDRTRTVLTRNDSPDIGFTWSINPYRGCEHGCIYCYARPTHEYLGFSAGLDFETRILVKEEAAVLLRRELQSDRWNPQPIALSGVTDPYQPVERKLCLTRRCMEVLVEFRNPVSVVTKNYLVTRDLDLLSELAEHDAVHVRLSITTLSDRLQRVLEPRTASPARRLAAIRALASQGIPVGVMVAPVIPGLTDHELPGILDRAREAGARTADYQVLRLPGSVSNLFLGWLERHCPERRQRVLSRIQDVRSGDLSDCRFHFRMTGQGEYADQIRQIFRSRHRKLGFETELPELSSRAFRRSGQLRLPWG